MGSTYLVVINETTKLIIFYRLNLRFTVFLIQYDIYIYIYIYVYTYIYNEF